MKKQLVIIGITVVLLIVGLSGCNTSSSPKDKFIGTWVEKQDKNVTFTFYNNGSVYVPFSLINAWSNYSIAGNKLIILNSVYEFTFSSDNQQLVLIINGINTIFERQ